MDGWWKRVEDTHLGMRHLRCEIWIRIFDWKRKKLDKYKYISKWISMSERIRYQVRRVVSIHLHNTFPSIMSDGESSGTGRDSGRCDIGGRAFAEKRVGWGLQWTVVMVLVWASASWRQDARVRNGNEWYGVPGFEWNLRWPSWYCYHCYEICVVVEGWWKEGEVILLCYVYLKGLVAAASVTPPSSRDTPLRSRLWPSVPPRAALLLSLLFPFPPTPVAVVLRNLNILRGFLKGPEALSRLVLL